MPLRFRSAAGKWLPDSDEVNAGEGVLLRADNTTSDELGSRSLRMGSRTIYSGLGEKVHSVYTANLQGLVYRFLGSDSSLYVDGKPAALNVSGSGDIVMCDDSYQAFFARGKTKLKYDGSKIRNWGIARPTKVATGEAIDTVSYQVATFDLTESVNTPAVVPAVVMKEGTGGSSLVAINPPEDDTDDDGPKSSDGWPKDYLGNENSAMAMRPDPGTGRASCQKSWDSDQDMFDFTGNYGGQSDLFDIRVWFQDPRKVDKVTIMFGLSTGDDPFLDDYYYFDFNIRNTGTVDIKDPSSTAASANAIVANTLLSAAVSPQSQSRVRTPGEAARVVKSVGGYAGPQSRERADTSAASPAWGHLTVTRGQFKRVGGTAGRDWKTVRGFKVVYTATPGSIEKVYLDDAIWTGGGSKALTGTFKIGYRFARVFRDKNGAEIYTELSPMSPISKDIVLQQQLLRVRIPASAVNNKDPQVNQVWIYLFGGWLDTYYRFATAAIGTIGMTIDDVSDPNAFSNDSPYVSTKLQRLIAHGFTANPLWDDIGDQDLVLKVNKSELEALTENEVYEPGAVEPPDRIISIAGPWNKRMFCLTDEGWLYPSTQKSPSSYSLYQTIDLRMYGTPYWVVKTVSGIFVGCSKDIIRIAGSGDNNDDNVTCDLFAQPLNVANPPVDRSVCVDGNMVGYRAADGPMLFSGASAEPLPTAGTSLLWRGQSRYGVPAFDRINGRFRFAVDNHIIYMAMPEGDTTSATIEYYINQPTVGQVVVVDKRTYRFAPNMLQPTYGKEGDVLIGATSNDTINNLINAINNNGGVNGVDYSVSGAHPTVTASLISAVSSTNAKGVVLLEATNVDAKLGLSTTVPTFNASQFETISSSVYRFSGGEWDRFVYPYRILALHREPDGSLLAGTDVGRLIEIEVGTNDDGSPIEFNLLYPLDDFGDPSTRKSAVDAQVHMYTAAGTCNFNLLLDESETPAITIPVATSSSLIYRASLLGLDKFYRAQAQITGSLHAMSAHYFGVSHTSSPKTVMAIDLGNVVAESGGDLAWINQVEIDCESPVDLYLDVYKGSKLHCSELVKISSDIRDVYTIVLPRDTKGRRLGLILRTTNADGEGRVGFELYSARVRHASTGNFTELPVGSGDDRSD